MQHYDKLFGLLLCLPILLSSNEETKPKGIINLRSMDTTMILGGKVSVDTIYLHNASGQTGGSNSSDQFFNANNIPINSKGEGTELTLSARNSKFWIKTRTAQKGEKPLMSLLEFDFWGSSGNEKNSNSHNIRLRHAYLLYKGWIIGQTNSLFSSSIKPSTLKAPVDDVFMRQPLIGYKKQLTKGSLSVSFEQPESIIMTPRGDKVTVNDDEFLDMVAKYQRDQSWGEYTLSVLARQLRVDQEDFAEDTTESVWGYGINLNSYITTFENNRFSLGLVGGEGIGRYMATSFFPGAILTEKGELKAQRSWGTHIGYEHWIDNNLRLNTAYGWIKSEPILELEEIDKSAWSIHIGLNYNPIKNFLLAGEYIHGTRILQNNQFYSVDRLYLQASYNF